MKMKNILFTSLTALTLGASVVSVPGVDQVLSNSVTVSAQEEVDQALVTRIKDNVAGYQPVNLEQLLEVSDADLVTYYNTAMDNPEIAANEGDVWQAVYEQIAANYPNLGLLTGEDYEAYYRVAEAISSNSQYSFSDLNMANPSQTLSLYRQAMANNGDDVALAVEEILPTLEQNITEYEERRAEREATESESEPETSTSSDASSIEDESTSDESSSEGNESAPVDPASVREDLIASTPILESQLAEISDERLVEYAEMYANAENPSQEIFNQIVSEFPTVFQSELDRIKDTLANDYGLNAESLNTNVQNVELLWLEYDVYLNNNGQENFEALATMLVENYGVAVDEENQAPTLEEINSSLLSSTPMTQEQLDQIPVEALEAYGAEAVGTESPVSYIYNTALVDYPEVFASEVTRFRESMVNDYNLSEESLNQVSDLDLLWLEYSVYINNDGQENMEALANQLVAEYNVEQAPGESSEQSSEETSEESTSESEEASSESESTAVESDTAVEENESPTPDESLESGNTELTPGSSIEPIETTESESESVSVSIESGVETAEQDELPSTGESSSWIITALAVVVLAIAGYFIYSGYKANKNNGDA